MNPFQDKVAMVTGGASGIGRALCEELARRSAVVIVADINGAGAQEVAAAIHALGGRTEAARLDVASAAEVEKAINDTASNHGRLDYLFNNAGIIVLGELRDVTMEHWRRIVEVNLLGVAYGTTAAYGVMARQGFGHIVNTASLGGLIPSPALSLYAATKYAVVGFSTSLREEAASLGVKVSVVCPGLVRTNIPDRTTYLNVGKEEYLARLPWRWMMDPSKAAKAILRGVARNRAIIVCPGHVRVLWWCYRLWPPLFTPLFRGSLREFRKLRMSS